ncbi:MAG: TolC family protein, partial [Planctomycetota bacterium]
LGIASTDGRVIRPIDEPTTAPLEFDWASTLDEAMSYRPELRQQRWEVKKRELALAYSKNALLPELNVTGLYRWLGLGNRLGTSQNNPDDFPGTTSGAINDLFGGEFQEFTLGIDYRIPIGLRRELSNVRNAQLKLARDIARIEDMELDVAREVSEAMRALDANRRVMQSSFNQWTQTLTEEEHFERIIDLGLETLDVALGSQRRKTEAASAFYTALCEYNKVLALLHRRKGTILAYNGIHFAEGPWPGKAYVDASEHARRRGASRAMNYGWTRPQVISRGEDYPTAYNSGSTQSVVAPTSTLQESWDPNVPTDYYTPQTEIIEPTQAPVQGSSTRNAMPQSNILPVSGESSPVIPTFIQRANFERPVAVIPQPSPSTETRAKSKPTTLNGTTPTLSAKKTTLPKSYSGQTLDWERFGIPKPKQMGTTTKINRATIKK